MSRPLHIALDARWIFPELSGIGLHTQELIAALVRAEQPHRFTLLFNDAAVMARTAALTGFTSHPAFAAELLPCGPLSPRDLFALPARLRSRQPDLYHSTNYTTPLTRPIGTRLVVTLYDLIPLLFRDYAPRSKKNRLFPLFKAMLKRAVNAPDAVIAISESTRADLIHHLLAPGQNPAKIHVVPCGVRPGYQPAPRQPHDGVHFLYVGRRDPYKNVPMLVEAIATLRAEGLPVHLIIIGSDDPRYPETGKLIARHKLEQVVTCRGYVTEAELLAAYQQADAFVLPSRYEGFGLPVVEAMACGTPVICSDSSSLPEVAGDAALFVDTTRPEPLIEAMRRLATDPTLRTDLARKGLARAARFTWEATARRTLAVYEAAARGATS